MNEAPPLPLIALDGALSAFRAATTETEPAQAENPLFAEGGQIMNLAPGLWLHADPGSLITGHWSRPAGRLIELAAHVARPGAWFGLHVRLSLPDLTGISRIALIAESSATPACAIWPCLRSGLPDGGFRDDFFARHILAQSRESDHHDILSLSRHPDLPRHAPWRELVLFLPPAVDSHLMLHDLRIFAL
jgi:hypothetical protein